MFLFSPCGNYLHDAKSPRSLEHGALAVNVESIRASRDGEQSEIGGVGAIPLPVGTVGVGNATEFIHGSNESSHEQEIDKGDKVGGVLCACVEEEGSQRPCCAEYGYDEEDED